MARRKEKDLLFYDEFYEMDLVSQAIALKILTEHHRYATEQTRRSKRDPKNDTAALIDAERAVQTSNGTGEASDEGR